MKKYFVLALAVLFVLGMTASAFAIHAEIPSETQAVVAKGASQITIGGELRFRGDYRANVNDFDNGVNNSGDQSYYDMRVRLSVEAKVTPNTTGFVQLESNSLSSASGSADNNFWGVTNSNQSGNSGSVQVGNQKQGSLNVLQAWILHTGSGLLGVPALVKVGHMPIVIGTGLFYSHDYQGDDAILVGVDPIKGLHVIAGMVKDYEGSTSKNDDVTGYALLVNYDINKDTAVGLDVTYVDDQNNGTAALSLNGIQTSGTGVTAAALSDVHFWNIGINGKTKIAGLGLYAEFDKQLGTFEGSAGEYKFTGWAAKGGVNYTFAPVTVGAEIAYGSGDNFNKHDDKINLFFTSQGKVQHYTYVYDYRTVNAAGNATGGLQNTFYIKASAAADITKALSANLDIYKLMAAQTAAISTGVYTTAGTSKDIGWEIDAKANYKIDRNLNYFVEAGYLFAGDFWKKATDTSFSPDDAWVVRHGIQLAF